MTPALQAAAEALAEAIRAEAWAGRVASEAWAGVAKAHETGGDLETARAAGFAASEDLEVVRGVRMRAYEAFARAAVAAER